MKKSAEYFENLIRILSEASEKQMPAIDKCSEAFAEALKNVTDPFAATEAEGLAAWEAVVEYFELAPADKKLISKEVTMHIGVFGRPMQAKLFHY